jgi:hypothetical protein
MVATVRDTVMFFNTTRLRLTRWGEYDRVIRAAMKTCPVLKHSQSAQTPSQSNMLEHAKLNIELMTLFGINGNMQTLALNNAMRKEFGVNLLETWSVNGLKSDTQEQVLTPSDLAERLDSKLNARKVNLLLIETGLQTSDRDHKNRIYYELTDKGHEYGVYLDTNKKHSDGTPVRQIKWYASVVDVLKAHLEAQCH